MKYHERLTLHEKSHQPSAVLEGLREVLSELKLEGLVRFSQVEGKNGSVLGRERAREYIYFRGKLVFLESGGRGLT